MRFLRRQDGLTLAEVLVGVTIIAIALSPMLGVLASSRKSMEGASRRQEAAAVARTVMDNMMARPFALIDSEGLATYAADSRYSYEVAVTPRTMADGTPYIKDIVVTVHWTEIDKNLSLTIYSAVTMRKT